MLRLLSLLIVPSLLHGQLRINEFMASNTRAYPEITDFEDYPDWIEIHNEGASAVTLDDIFLSDDPLTPLKWQFPAGSAIDAGGYLLVMADGHDAGPGETHPRGYWPWRDFVTEKYHSNFGLSSSGESVVLTQALGITTTTVIAADATWSYLDDGSNQSTQWRARSFDDSNWASGPAELGYGDAQTTEVSFGEDSSDKHITTYFRHSFNLADPTLFHGLAMTIQADDGAIVYLNGAEIARQNMPAGEVNSETRALETISGSDETDFTAYRVPLKNLVSGENVIAVEIHQRSSTSSDMSFALTLTADSHTSRTTLDTVTYTQQVSDVSCGRDATDPSIWVQYAESTAGTANGGPIVSDVRLTSDDTSVTPAAGFYDTDQTITLSSSGGDIYYTLDGSNPTTSSTRYTVPFTITDTTIVRARAFESGKVPGAILTSSYLYDETFNGLPIISAVADPETLFGDVIGIYNNMHEPVTSGMNEVYKGKDAPGHIEFFPVNGSAGFAVNGGFRIGGENNWGSHDQKALNFSLRGKYGDDEIKYDLFPGSGIPIHSAITLREGGDDWDDAMLRDAMWNTIAKNQINAETNTLQPCVVFLNGLYWGVYNIRSRWNKQWFFENYGVDSGDYNHIGYGHFTSSDTTLGAFDGDTTEWTELLEFIDANDIDQPGPWAFVESRVDIDSFIDFVVSESYANNTSWGHNREMWKANAPGSKWRWLLADMDRTFKLSSLNANEFADILREDALLVRIKNQPQFKARLAQRFAAHVASTFEPTRIAGIVDTLGALITPELTRHKERWPDSIDPAQQAIDIQEIKDYATQREANVYPEIANELSLDSAVDLTLAVTGVGSFKLSGVPVDPKTLKIFPNLDASIEAIPAPGYTFDSWIGLTGGAATTLNIAGSNTITANFIPTGGTVTGGTLTSNTTFNAAGSPYGITSDLIVPSGVTLTIDAGVTLEMSQAVNIRVMGTLNIQGTAGEKVNIRGERGATWGGISFEEPTTASTLTHLIVRNASRGKEPTIYPAGIAGLNAEVIIDFLDIAEGRGPLFFRGGSTILRDSIINIPLTGDGINVKQGMAETYRTTFTGNNSVDTDAIDYDGVTNGIIQDCRIYNFRGFNSDGIDTGEQCVNVLIEGNTIFYNSDKGVSVGQGSSVVMRNNIIVGCAQGVGVKDYGSTILVDQCTFVDCAEAVTSFEKNFGKGGGDVTVTNTIFSGCDIPVSSDRFSTLVTSYSLSDTSILSGSNNLNTDPLFLNANELNFQLAALSPAKDSGDPSHTLDPDATQADRGALYLYDPDDYPFEIGETVVVNEILSNSGTAPDWIELYNRSDEAIDIGGWFLSDSSTELAKYRIPTGTTIPANGYLVFYEDSNFGPDSTDPNRISGFGLSDNGETIYLTSAEDDVLTDYRFREDFNASLEGVTLGYYYKPGSDTYNFVPLQSATQAGENSAPIVGPIVISEIMYNPAGAGGAEYIELLNITDAPVTLFDADADKAWKFTDGIEYEFPALSPLTMASGERVILTRSITDFHASFNVPVGTQVFEWTTGKLSGGGEVLQLGRPGPVNSLNETQYIRVDRVKYNNNAPWPTSPDGGGPSLTKIAEYQYGNDHLNWQASAASPGEGGPGLAYTDWATANGIIDPLQDDDSDGISNLAEYALGTDPTVGNTGSVLSLIPHNGFIQTSYAVNLDRPDVEYLLESSLDLQSWTEVSSPPLSVSDNRQYYSVTHSLHNQHYFYRLKLRLKP